LRVKLLFVLGSAKYFLTHRMALARAALDAGYDVHVAAPAAPEAKTIAQHGFEFHAIPLGRGLTAPWREARLLSSLVSLYRRLQPTLVHHVALKAILHGTCAARIEGVPAVVNAVTGLGYLFTKGSAGSTVLRSTFVTVARPVLRRRNLLTTFQNDDDLEVFVRLGLADADHAVVIRGSGVDTVAFAPSQEPDGLPVIALPSRMLWDKGVGVFVEAAKALREQGVRARFVLVGDGDPENPRSITREQLAGWQAAGIVEWWGHRPDMPRVFSESTIVVLPSMYREGVPKSLIEAASSGRPIVTTDMPGCRDIVQHGKNGLLIPPGDAAALARAVAELIGDAPLRQRMGAFGRSLVEREFAQEGVIARTLAVYDSALADLAAAQSAPAA
jgi:glycosyltransferase involved in cell wall biosynthesis